LFYEEAYTNAPGDVVARRHSTNVTVRVEAYGGKYGGLLKLTQAGFDKLSFVSGDVIPQGSVMIGERERRIWEAEYAPFVHSNEKDDVAMVAHIEEYVNGEKLLSHDEMTIIEVEFRPKVEAPDNKSRNRHIYGVREYINCYQRPNIPEVEWISNNNRQTTVDSEFLCPLVPTENPLKVRCLGSEYVPSISVVAPSGIEAREVGYEVGNVLSNSAGGLLLTMEIYVTPLDVSFGGIAIEEVPDVGGSHSGYFSHSEFASMWNHSRANGAGEWIKVDVDNFAGFDRAGITNGLLRITSDGILIDDENYGWIYGSLNWQNPFGWNELDTSGTSVEFARFAEGVQQEMIIFPNGMFGVRKHKNIAVRYIDGRVYLNGEQKE
jgi:hypothetical protein